MAITGKLGTIDSLIGNIVLGEMGDLASTVLEQEVGQTITFTQEAVVGQISVLVSQSLGLIDHAQAVAAQFVDDVITFIDSADAFRARPGIASDTIVFTEDVRQNIFNLLVEESLGLIETITFTGPVYQEINHFLHFEETFDGHKGINHQSAAHIIDFQEKAGRTHLVTISQAMTLTEVGERRHAGVDTITFVQTVSAGKGHTVAQTLSLVQTVVNRSILQRPLAQTLTLHQSATFILEGDCVEKNYTPFIGFSTDDEFASPTPIAPTLGNATLTLTHPFVSPTTTLILRNPEFGNKDRLQFNRINRETRGGTLVIYADPTWPKLQLLQLDIDGLKGAQLDDLRTFLAVSLGQEIGLLDYENRQWKGIITNPDLDLSHTGRSDRAATLEFEGVLV